MTPRTASGWICKVEWPAGFAAAGCADGFRRNRQLSAAQSARGAWRIGILAGIEGVAAAALRGRGLLLHGSLLRSLIVGRLTISRAWLRRRNGRDVGACGGRWRAAGLQLPQLILEHLVTMVQFLVLSGQRSQPFLELLDAHFGVNIVIGLRESK